MQNLNLLNKFDNHIDDTYSVSLCVFLNEDSNANHAGILIKNENDILLVHYPGINNTPEITSIFDLNYFHSLIYKTFNFIEVDNKVEVESVISICNRICENSEIQYGFIHDGSFYDENGFFQPNTNLPEVATCVGFCLNIINSILVGDDKYIEIEDWDNGTMPINYLDYTINSIRDKYPEITQDEIIEYSKRITPLQYIISSLFTDLPIRKQQIDEQEGNVIVKLLELDS